MSKMPGTASNTEPKSPDIHDQHYLKLKREKEVRNNFGRYMREIVAKEGANTVTVRKEGEAKRRIEGEVDKVIDRIAQKATMKELMAPDKGGTTEARAKQFVTAVRGSIHTNASSQEAKPVRQQNQQLVNEVTKK